MNEFSYSSFTDKPKPNRKKLSPHIKQTKRLSLFKTRPTPFVRQSKQTFPLLALLLISFTIYLYILNDVSVRENSSFVKNNSTERFEMSVILISIDGFRSDYLNDINTPFMNQLKKEGLYANDGMIPSFPTLTFPNHYTLVTGLYPNDHGIIANDFKHESYNIEFDRKSSIANKRYWWGGEPIWTTLNNHNKKSYVHMMPGAQVEYNEIEAPTYITRYNRKINLNDKVYELFNFIDLPFEERPLLFSMYIEDVDYNGHHFGTRSKVLKQKLFAVDNMIKQIFCGLKERNLQNMINVVIVSDHGMADINPKSTIHLPEFVDMDLIEKTYVYPYAGIMPKNINNTQTIYNQLRAASDLPNSHFKVFLKHEIPSKYNYGSNIRIPPILAIQESGYAFDTNTDKKKKIIKGLHGYDNFNTNMRALFVAYGPGFQNKKIQEPLKNTNIYNLLCMLLNVSPSSNNGTIDWTKYLTI